MKRSITIAISISIAVTAWRCSNHQQAAQANREAIRNEIDRILEVQETAYDQQTEESRIQFAVTCDDSLFFVSGDEGGLSTSAEFYTHDFADGYIKKPYNKQYRILDNTVIVTFLTQTFKRFNKDTIFFNSRGTKIFTKQGNEWKMSYVTYAPVPVNYTARKEIATNLLKDYQGLYAEDSRTTDTIVVVGNKLFLAATGAPRTELVAINDSSFISEGYFGKTVFSRNAEGDVTHNYFEFTDGQRLVFPRVK